MRSVVVKTRRSAIAARSLLGLALLVTALPAPAPFAATLTLDGAAVAGAPVYFSGSGIPSSTARIVVIPFFAPPLVAGAASTPQLLLCYLGSPTALGTADVTTDSLGNIGPTLVWSAAVPGSYRALLLQGSCAPDVIGGRSPQDGISDERIVAEQDFTVGVPIPTLSPWGFAALGLALSVAGWGFLRTRS
jgi:hypothetical protein